MTRRGRATTTRATVAVDVGVHAHISRVQGSPLRPPAAAPALPVPRALVGESPRTFSENAALPDRRSARTSDDVDATVARRWRDGVHRDGVRALARARGTRVEADASFSCASRVVGPPRPRGASRPRGPRRRWAWTCGTSHCEDDEEGARREPRRADRRGGRVLLRGRNSARRSARSRPWATSRGLRACDAAAAASRRCIEAAASTLAQAPGACALGARGPRRLHRGRRSRAMRDIRPTGASARDLATLSRVARGDRTTGRWARPDAPRRRGRGAPCAA